MKIKLYIDEDIYGAFASVLCQHKIDAESVLESNKCGFEDSDQLAYAVTTQRAILTFNRQHYESLAVEYFLNGQNHYGIIISPQYKFGELLNRVLKLVETTSAEEMYNQIRYLQSIKM